MPKQDYESLGESNIPAFDLTNMDPLGQEYELLDESNIPVFDLDNVNLHGGTHLLVMQAVDGEGTVSTYSDPVVYNQEPINYVIRKQTLVNIANSVRAKTGKTDLIPTENIAAEIDSIVISPGIPDTPDSPDIPVINLQKSKTVYKNNVIVEPDQNYQGLEKVLVHVETVPSSVVYVDDTTLTILPQSSDHREDIFDVFIDGKRLASIDANKDGNTTFDLSSLHLSIGEHNASVIAKSNNYMSSDMSNIMSFDIYPETQKLTIINFNSVKDSVTFILPYGHTFQDLVDKVDDPLVKAFSINSNKQVLYTGKVPYTITSEVVVYDPTDPEHPSNYYIATANTLAEGIYYYDGPRQHYVEFTINGDTGYADRYMTWRNWLNSVYTQHLNGQIYITSDNTIRMGYSGDLKMNNGTIVRPDDTIIENHEYVFVFG